MVGDTKQIVTNIHHDRLYVRMYKLQMGSLIICIRTKLAFSINNPTLYINL